MGPHWATRSSCCRLVLHRHSIVQHSLVRTCFMCCASHPLHAANTPEQVLVCTTNLAAHLQSQVGVRPLAETVAEQRRRVCYRAACVACSSTCAAVRSVACSSSACALHRMQQCVHAPVPHAGVCSGCQAPAGRVSCCGHGRGAHAGGSQGRPQRPAPSQVPEGMPATCECCASCGACAPPAASVRTRGRWAARHPLA